MLLERRHIGGGTILVEGERVPFWWDGSHHAWVIDTNALGKKAERVEYHPNNTFFHLRGKIIASQEIFKFIERVY